MGNELNGIFVSSKKTGSKLKNYVMLYGVKENFIGVVKL